MKNGIALGASLMCADYLGTRYPIAGTEWGGLSPF